MSSSIPFVHLAKLIWKEIARKLLTSKMNPCEKKKFSTVFKLFKKIANRWETQSFLAIKPQQNMDKECVIT